MSKASVSTVPPPPPNSSPSNPDTSINWANFIPIGTSPAFYYKNVLPYAEEYELSLQRQLGSSVLVSLSYVGLAGASPSLLAGGQSGQPGALPERKSTSEVAPGTSTCGPNGENGVYTTTTGATINGTRGPFGQNFTSEG